MTTLASLRQGYNAVVFGAAGGVGSALVALLDADPRCASILAGARRPIGAQGKAKPFVFDLEDEASIDMIAQSAAEIREGIDLVIVATGVLHADGLQPEKSFRALSGPTLARSFALNAIGPALIAKHFLPLLTKGSKSLFAALSARVGSIVDNQKGGWHAYRASKAALNQLIRTCAIETATRNKNAVCVTLHPGTVDTAMSKPFQGNVPPHKLFTAETSARHLLGVIDTLTPAENGGFFAWDGQRIPF